MNGIKRKLVTLSSAIPYEINKDQTRQLSDSNHNKWFLS